MFALYLCQVDIIYNLSVCQQGGLEHVGCSKELLSLSQGAAMGFMLWPVSFLAVTVAVDTTDRISRLVLWRVHANNTPHCCVRPTVCTLREIC
jgi:hypothetical protein